MTRDRWLAVIVLIIAGLLVIVLSATSTDAGLSPKQVTTHTLKDR